MTPPKLLSYKISYTTSLNDKWLTMPHICHNLGATREYIKRYMLDQLRLHPTLTQRYMIDQQGTGPIEAGELLPSGRLTRTTLHYHSQTISL